MHRKVVCIQEAREGLLCAGHSLFTGCVLLHGGAHFVNIHPAANTYDLCAPLCLCFTEEVY